MMRLPSLGCFQPHCLLHALALAILGCGADTSSAWASGPGIPGFGSLDLAFIFVPFLPPGLLHLPVTYLTATRLWHPRTGRGAWALAALAATYMVGYVTMRLQFDI